MSSPRVPQPNKNFNERAVETPNGASARSMAESERLIATSRASLNRMGANLTAARNVLNQMKANVAATGADLNSGRASTSAAAAALAEQKARVNALAANIEARREAGRAASRAKANSQNASYKKRLLAKLAVRGPRRVSDAEFASLRAAAFKESYGNDFAAFHNARGTPSGVTSGKVARAPPKMTLNNANFKSYKGGKKTRRSARRSKRSTRRH